MVAKKEESVNPLTKEKVTVRYIKKGSDLIKDPKHIAYGGMLDTSEFRCCVKMNQNGTFADILTQSEQSFLEKRLFLEEGHLSKHNTKYWAAKTVLLYKDDTILDLSDPEDYINYKILLTNTNIVARDLDNIHSKKSYKYVLIKENEEVSRKANKATITQKCWMSLGKINGDKDKMHYALKMTTGKVMSMDTNLDGLYGLLGDAIETDADNFRRICEDVHFNTKVLIDTATRLGVLNYSSNEYLTKDNKPLSEKGKKATLEEAAAYLNAPENQEIKHTIEARIKAARE